MSALERWANEVEDLFKVSCWFQCSEPVLIHDEAVANHVYRIAQEAVNTAVKHGRARRIIVRLGTENGAGYLTVEDDGSGSSGGPGQPLRDGTSHHELSRSHDWRVVRRPPLRRAWRNPGRLPVSASPSGAKRSVA